MDYHNAAASGSRFEKNFSKFLNSLGLTALKRKADFERRGLIDLYDTLKKISHPEGWDLDSNRKNGTRGSESDGVILEYKLAYEHKGATKSGTTEEKIWWELKKLEVGITPNRYLFVFAGKLENEYHATHFMEHIEQLRESGDERFTHVYCVKQTELTREWLNERYESNTPKD